MNAVAHTSALASKGIEDDAAGALQLSYETARQASAALLVVQGLRATTRGTLSAGGATGRSTPTSTPLV